MNVQVSLLLLIFAVFLSPCTHSDAFSSQSQKRTERQGPAASAAAQTVARGASAAAGKDGLGILELPDGSRFKTTLYELKVIGQLRSAHKLPFYILSGRGCQECDANTSIYIHSPSDGPMKNEAEQQRFHYPGRELDYEDSSLLYEGRMFFGDCVALHPNAAVWFQRYLGEDKQWHASVFLAELKDDKLITEELRGELPTVTEAQDAVRKGRCQELPGVDGSSEP